MTALVFLFIKNYLCLPFLRRSPHSAHDPLTSQGSGGGGGGGASLRRARRWNATGSFFDGALTRWHFNGTSASISTRKAYEARSTDEIHTRRSG